jgi:secreted protein with Ig-like and vWFA domain
MKAPWRQARQKAETLAIQGLAFIAADPERLARFLELTGVAPSEIRAAARTQGFLAGVLEHMLGDESLLIAFAADAGIAPGEVARARGALRREQDRNTP